MTLAEAVEQRLVVRLRCDLSDVGVAETEADAEASALDVNPRDVVKDEDSVGEDTVDRLGFADVEALCVAHAESLLEGEDAGLSLIDGEMLNLLLPLLMAEKDSEWVRVEVSNELTLGHGESDGEADACVDTDGDAEMLADTVTDAELVGETDTELEEE